MNNSSKKLLFLFIVILGFVFFIESNKQDPINWNMSLDNTDKAPYGTYILDQEIDKIFPNDSIVRTDTHIYDFFNEKKYDSINRSNFLSIKNYNFIDSFSRVKLNEYLFKGNTAIIFQNDIDGIISGVTNTSLYYELDDSNIEETELSLTLANPNISTYSFKPKGINAYFFDIPDSLRNKIEVLGYLKYKGVKYPNIIRYKKGNGQLILGLQSVVFTNYNLLESNNHLYAQGILSYFPQQKTYFSVTRLPTDTEYHSTSILRFVFKNPALRWAWYFFLGTIVLFIVFTAKRKQRVIPVIKPLSNTTVEFTKTVSNLYIQNRDYDDLMNKQIIYTLEKIRREYWIDTNKLDERFVNSLQAKTKRNREDIVKFISFVERFRASNNYASEASLIELNKLIEKIID